MGKEKNKKIIIATGIFPPDIGGPATYSLLLVSELKKVGKNVIVVTYSDDDKEYDFKVNRISRKQNIFLRYLKYFYIVFRNADFNSVIYAQDPISSGIPAYFASLLKGSKFFLKIVGDYAWEQGSIRAGVAESIEDFQKKKYGFFVSLMKFIERFVAKRANLVVTPSEFLKKIVNSWGVKEDKINVILNSYDSKNTTSCKTKDAGKIVLVSVGRLVPWKGFFELIDVISDILKEDKDVILNIIGDGPDKVIIKEKIKSLKLENFIFLKGKLSRDEVFCELKNSDIFILNTRYEGFSHILLEAMDAGLPIITTNICGNPEVIKDQETGILIDLGNKEALKYAILKLKENSELRNKLSKNAKKSLVYFSKEIMIKKTFDALNI